MSGGNDNTRRFGDRPRSRHFVNLYKIAGGFPVKLDIVTGSGGSVYKVNSPDCVAGSTALLLWNGKARIAVGIS